MIDLSNKEVETPGTVASRIRLAPCRGVSPERIASRAGLRPEVPAQRSGVRQNEGDGGRARAWCVKNAETLTATAFPNCEILALAISLEEEDMRDPRRFRQKAWKKDSFPASADVFKRMRAEESTPPPPAHRANTGRGSASTSRLIRREDVKGFVYRKPVWLIRPLGLDTVRNQGSAMEEETRRFYEKASARTHDPAIRQLLDDLAQEERSHQHRAEELEEDKLRRRASRTKEDRRPTARLFVLQIVQPGLAGLMDGSVSTLAPVFAAAFATHSSWDAFRVGLAASLGAGISMGFAEALSDDGSLTGRGHPWVRGIGLRTDDRAGRHRAIRCPSWIPDFRAATTAAVVVVLAELGIIAWIRHRYMESSALSATLQVGLGGALVFAHRVS